MAYTMVLGTIAARLAGSSPVSVTIEVAMKFSVGNYGRMMISCVASFVGCGQPKQEWPSKTKAILEDGTPVEICVYYEPLEGDGFVINVHRPDDPVGKCWGTVIYPKPVKDN